MKTKKIVSLSMALAIAATASTAAFAAELTDQTPSGETEVTARIVNTGEVSYIITIPDKVDFGVLTKPETNTDSFKDVSCEVEATLVNLEQNSKVLVSVKDKNVREDITHFSITQDREPNTVLDYDVYLSDVFGKALDANKGSTVALFKETGDKAGLMLRLNQKQLFDKDLSELAGNYSGNMVFTSSVLTQG